EAHVERDLVVAGASGVELCAGWGAASELGFDVHVNVFQLRLPGKVTRADFRADFLQTAIDLVQLSRADEADLLEHSGVGEGAADVMLPKAPVEGDRLGKLGHVISRAGGKPAAARDWRAVFGALHAEEICGPTGGK